MELTSSMYKKIMTGLILLVCVSIMTGCVVKKAKVVLKNLKEITKPKDGISTVDMMVYATDEININALGEATPINFLVIQMENDLKLYEATFDELSAGIKEALKDDYVSHKEYKVLPGKFVAVGLKELKDKTKHLAVVAAYKELDQVIWRTSHKVKSVGKKYAAHIAMKKSGIKMEVKASE